MGCGSSNNSSDPEEAKNKIKNFYFPQAFLNKIEDLKAEKQPFVLNFDLKDSEITDEQLLECFKAVHTLPKIGTLQICLTGAGAITDAGLKAAFESLFDEKTEASKMAAIIADFTGCSGLFGGDDHGKELLETVQKLKSVKTVDLKFSETGFTEAGATNFAKQLKTEGTTMVNLNLDFIKCNAIGNKGFVQLLKHAFQLDEMKCMGVDLNFSECGLTLDSEEDRAALMADQPDNAKLQSLMLKLGGNPMTHEGILALSNFTATAKEVKSIIMDYENCQGVFETEEAGHAFSGLKTVGKSTYFKLKNSGFNAEAAKGLAKALSEFEELNNLDLDLNENPNLGNEGAIAILKQIFNMDKQNLKKFDCYMNGCGITLDDEAQRNTLFADQPELENLLSIELRLRDNNITNEGFDALRQLLYQGRKIKDMNLSLQPLDVEGMKIIQKCMDEFKSLLNMQMVFTGQTVDPEALKELGEGIKITDYLIRFEALFWEGGKVEGWEEAQVREFFEEIKKKKNFLYRQEIEFFDPAGKKKEEFEADCAKDEAEDRVTQKAEQEAGPIAKAEGEDAA